MHPPSDPAPTGATFTALDHHQCMNLLAGAHIGRLGFTHQALPVVWPVNFALHEESIVFWTASGTIGEAAARGDVACLEIDDHDALAHEGWSVLATGRLRVVTDERSLAEVAGLPLASWRPMGRPNVVRLPIDLLSGRRIAAVPALRG